MQDALLSIENQLKDSNWTPDLILGINRGGCIPGVYLSHKLNIPHEVIDIRLRDHMAPPNLQGLNEALSKKVNILIIDDINDSGATFNYIITHFVKLPEAIRFAALITNQKSAVTVDYNGPLIDKEINPEWIVFPWEGWFD